MHISHWTKSSCYFFQRDQENSLFNTHRQRNKCKIPLKTWYLQKTPSLILASSSTFKLQKSDLCFRLSLVLLGVRHSWRHIHILTKIVVRCIVVCDEDYMRFLFLFCSVKPTNTKWICCFTNIIYCQKTIRILLRNQHKLLERT